MREALARTDDDFVLAAPARPRRAKKKASPGVMSQMSGALLRKPGRTLAVVVFAGLLCGVVANALFFQTARHPAPMFQKPAVTRQAQPAPQPRPVEKAPAQQQAAPLTPPMPPVPPAQVRSEAPAKDQIGALLSGGAVHAPAPVAAAAPKVADDSARVLAAQKALQKLGYVIKPDGVMGAGTRKAVEMFEQSRKLPVTGDISNRVARELSAQSGVAVP